MITISCNKLWWKRFKTIIAFRFWCWAIQTNGFKSQHSFFICTLVWWQVWTKRSPLWPATEHSNGFKLIFPTLNVNLFKIPMQKWQKCTPKFHIQLKSVASVPMASSLANTSADPTAFFPTQQNTIHSIARISNYWKPIEAMVYNHEIERKTLKTAIKLCVWAYTKWNLIPNARSYKQFCERIQHNRFKLNNFTAATQKLSNN